MSLTCSGLNTVILLTPRLFHRLPYELWARIIDIASQMPQRPTTSSHSISPQGPFADPAVPKDGYAPFRSLPPELVRKIIAASMPTKNRTIRCLCGPAPEKEADRKPRPNRVSDLMTLSREFKNSVKAMIYEERFFELHIHQGGTGGVELLDVGHQPLAYMESDSDDRFAKFTMANEYGFRHLKKIEIAIFPSTDTQRSKAVTLNTYFMVHALCRLLERGGKEEDRIVSINITFPRNPGNKYNNSRHGIMCDEHYWWDPQTRTPRCTSIYGIPDIELALHPFVKLTRVHHVHINLPARIKTHQPTVTFITRLIAGMTSTVALPNMLLSCEQEAAIQSMRQEVENYIFAQKFGRHDQDVEKLREDAMQGSDEDEDDFDGVDEDEGVVLKHDQHHVQYASLNLSDNRVAKRLKTGGAQYFFSDREIKEAVDQLLELQ